MGRDYTIADIATLGWVRNLIGFYDARELVGFDAFDNVAAWLERGLARPAVQRGLSNSQAELNGVQPVSGRHLHRSPWNCTTSRAAGSKGPDMAKAFTAFALSIAMVLASPAAAWTPDFDAAFDPFPHRGLRRQPPTVGVALPVAKPAVTVRRRASAPSSASSSSSSGSADVSRRLAAYCARPGKSSLSWIRVGGQRHYCSR